MGIIWTILIGFVVGLLAKMLTPAVTRRAFSLPPPLVSPGRWWLRSWARRWGGITRANPQASSVH